MPRRSIVGTKLIVMLVSVSLGFLLVTRGIPNTASAFHALEAAPILHRLSQRDAASVEELRAAAAALDAAFAWSANPKLMLDRGVVAFYLARRASLTSEHRDRLLHEAEAAVIQSLSLAPSNPRALTFLSLLQMGRQSGGQEAADTLALSLATGEQEATLAFLRIRLLIRLAPYLEDGGRAALLKQIRLAERRDRERLVDWALRDRKLRFAAMAALRADPDKLAAFVRTMVERSAPVSQRRT